jgi:hypothetical protein
LASVRQELPHRALQLSAERLPVAFEVAGIAAICR